MGGKKKQKVKWCAVDGLKWNTNEDESSPEGSVTGKENYSHQQNQYGGHGNYNGSGQAHYNGGQQGQYGGGGHGNYGGPGRRQSQPWLHNGVAPRFDRRSQRQVYYDGEYCDAEEMPNGFTKIRSKNLDILFKRNYYEHRVTKAREEGTEETVADPPEPSEEPSKETPEPQNTSQEAKPFRSCKSFDQIDPSEIPEFRPMNSITTSVASDPETELNSGEVSPQYYPPYYNDQGGYNYSAAPPRPNLYLYSPTNNTLIPCEEIIIPAEGSGTSYPGPANIYLAYPVQGPDGRGYITQQFSPPIPGEPYLSYPCYSPSMSLDGSQYQSSTPQTPNSGQDSGSSTQPTSPPPLLNYHPANWFQEQHMPITTQEELPNRTVEPVTKDAPAAATASIRPEPAKPAAVVETPTLKYIPGLPPVDTNTKKKSQKKKKTKKSAVTPVSAATAGHRGSVSSDCSGERVSPAAEMPSSPYGNSPVVEVNLTDDLADYMVNPPTDPEVSDEETTLTLVSGAAENIPSLPRDDTICNMDESLFLEDLPMEENLSEVGENLVDGSGMEKALEIQQSQSKSDASIGAPQQLAAEECGGTQEELCNIQVETCCFIQESVIEPVQSVKDPEPVPTEQAALLTGPESASDQSVAEPFPVQTAQDSESVQVSQPQPIPTDTPTEETKLNPERNLIEKESIETVESILEGNKSSAPQANVEETLNVPGKAKKKKTKRKNTETKPAFPKVLEFPAPQENHDIPTEKSSKMTYSAVCKTKDPKPSRPIQPLPQSVPTQPKGQPQKVEGVDEPTKVESPNDAAWETLPPTLSSSLGQWEKKDRKRKKKGGTVVAFDDVPQVFEEEVKIEEKTVQPEIETAQPPAETTEEEAKVEEDAEEKKRVRKKKKKHSGSQEPEEAGHRVIIHDNQVEIRVTRVVRRASEVLGSSHMEEVRRSGHLDFLVVDQLGSGISRGCIHNGRLYQGKYVPPARVDGLLPPSKQQATAETMEQGEETSVKNTEEIDLD